MSTTAAARPLELLPPVAQTLWGWPAVVNFVCGGLGAGLYLTAALAAGFRASPALTLAAWLGPVLVLVGFGAVALEAGRPLRGPRVLARVGTSWMSRELWLGGAFVTLALAEFALGWPWQRLLAASAAAALALAQGFILRRARAVPAWAVAPVPLLHLTSALVSGAGLLLLLQATREVPSARLLGGAQVLLTAHLVVWWAYIAWSRDEAFARAVRPLREGPGALAIVGAGYLAPALLIPLAVAFPGLALPLSVLGAVLMLAGQVHTKAALILRAGQLRPVTLAHPLLERRSR